MAIVSPKIWDCFESRFTLAPPELCSAPSPSPGRCSLEPLAPSAPAPLPTLPPAGPQDGQCAAKTNMRSRSSSSSHGPPPSRPLRGPPCIQATVAGRPRAETRNPETVTVPSLATRNAVTGRHQPPPDLRRRRRTRSVSWSLRVCVCTSAARVCARRWRRTQSKWPCPRCQFSQSGSGWQ